MQKKFEIKSIWKNWNLKSKILCCFIIVIAIGMISCSLMFTYLIRGRVLKQFCENEVDLMKNISDKEQYIYENITNISSSFLLDSKVQRFLAMEPTGDAYEDLQRYQAVEEKIRNASGVFSNMKYSVTLMGLHNNSYISNDSFFDKETNRQRMEAYRKILDEKEYQLIWVGTVNDENRNIITATSYIPDLQNGNPIGMVIFDFDEEVFGKTYKKYVGEQESILITNQKGEILSASEQQKIGQSINGTQWAEELDGYREGYFYDKENKNLVIFVKDSTSKMCVWGTVGYDNLMEPYKKLMKSLPLVVISIVGLCLFVSHKMSRSISKPLGKLTGEIRNYCAGQERTYDEKQSGDEIAYLNREYHFMIQRLEKMIEDIYKEQELKRKYEIEFLKGQIKPHFLYNTLLSIRYLNLTEKKEDVDKSLAALSNILAVYFKSKSSWQTVEEEMEFLKNYCYIQQIRYGNNFESKIEYGEETAELFLPKMILQPVVENAVFHGLSSYEEGGEILIFAEKKEDRLEIIIKDNGIGFQNGKEKKKEEGHGIGMINVRERLGLIYGENASLVIESTDGKGTTVTFSLPVQMEGDENESDDCG